MLAALLFHLFTAVNMQDGTTTAPKEPVERRSVEPRLDDVVSNEAPTPLDDTTLIATEWLRLKHQVSEGRIRRRADYFVGFLSGRLRTQPPKWWRREIRSARVFDAREVVFSSRGLAAKWKTSQEGYRYTGFERVTSGKNGLILSSGSLAVSLSEPPFEIVDKTKGLWDPETINGIAGVIDREICVIAFRCPDDLGGPSELYCVETPTAKLLWKCELDMGLPVPMGFSGGFNGSFTEIILDAENVYVWSSHDISASVQVFRRTDGRLLSHFISCHLNNRTFSDDLK